MRERTSFWYSMPVDSTSSHDVKPTHENNPSVSIIVPCYNEQQTIALLLEAIYNQTYPRECLEVVIADGMSQDQTRQRISQFQENHPELKLCVVDNPRRIIPSALNQAVKASHGKIIVRLDAHCVPRSDYVARSAAGLLAGLGDNVGGVWEILPGSSGWIGRSIAAAASHPLGVGDALYRFTDRAGETDTVPFGAYRRELLARIPQPVNGDGPYNESLLTNEDYELNTRIRQSGGRIWLDPEIRSQYYARPNIPALARQYWRYGFWKARMLRENLQTIRLRQALPPLFIASLILLGCLALFFPLARWLLAIELLLYALTLLLVGAQLALRQKDFAMLAGVPLAIATMHGCWGGGFLWSLLPLPTGNR